LRKKERVDQDLKMIEEEARESLGFEELGEIEA